MVDQEASVPATTEAPAAEVTLDQLMGSEESTGGVTADSPAAQGEQPATEQKPASHEETVPYSRFKELNETNKQIQEKLTELEGFKTSYAKAVEWVDFLKNDPELAKAVIQLQNDYLAKKSNPALANMADDDPQKALLMQLNELKNEIGSLKKERDGEKTQTEQQRRVAQAAEELRTEWKGIKTKSKSEFVKSILSDSFHEENILRRFADKNNKKTLEQVAIEYVQKMPGVKVDTEYYRSKKGPKIAKGGGAPAGVTDTSKMTLDDPELSDMVDQAISAFNAG